jgi:plasmid stabilization system protein ParE
MDKVRVELHPEAVREAAGARLWYADRNKAAADAFVADLDDAIRRITDDPKRWPRHLESTRQFPFRRFPFVVVYRELEESIQIVTVAHVRRRPGYWLARVD